LAELAPEFVAPLGTDGEEEDEDEEEEDEEEVVSSVELGSQPSTIKRRVKKRQVLDKSEEIGYFKVDEKSCEIREIGAN